MPKILRRIVPAIIVILALIVAFSGGVIADRTLLAGPLRDPLPPGSPPDFSLIREAWDRIDSVYVDRAALQSQPLTYGAISGMVSALGDTGHSAFLSPEMVRQQQSFMQGSYVGVGMEIQMKEGQVVIVAPMDGSPALEAGLRSGEVILKVDGADISGLSLQEVVQRIVGEAGTPVTLTVFDAGSVKTFDVTLKRARIELKNVSWKALPGTDFADLRIAAFSERVTKDLKAALEEIRRGGFRGIVLDLRNDPGGILDEAIGVTSQFLDRGNVLLEKNAAGLTQPVPVQPGGLAPDVPMVVLINGGTASAAEIVAGALQDAQRASLVGEKTFGTGTVLGMFPLSDGSQLLLATREWLTPKGREIWHQGISPDIPVVHPAGTSPLRPATLDGMTPQELRSSGDAQLLKAIDVLSAQQKSQPKSAALSWRPIP